MLKSVMRFFSRQPLRFPLEPNRESWMRWKQAVRARYWQAILAMQLTDHLGSRLLRGESDTSLGARGERAAERYLLRQGYIVMFRGYEDRTGEIDLVAVDGETVVFVEVKTRSSLHAGSPEEAVDAEKQMRLSRTGIGFMKWHRLTDYPARFDVVAIVWDGNANSRFTIRHHKNAFEPTGDFQMYG